jgi:rare lipoprotein A
MRRFRLRRRPMAAAALAPTAAIFTTTAFAEQAPPTGESAGIDASSRSVPFGEPVSLHGAFPGAGRAPIQILHRATGAGAWRTVERARTDADGRYAVRVKPRRNGHWRAELAAATAPEQGVPAGEPVPSSSAVDTGTGSERIDVRSRTTATVSDRHTLAGRTVKVRGRVRPAGAERRVVVDIGSDRQGIRAGRDGRFGVRWKVPDTGSYGIDVEARSNRLATASRYAAGKLTAYRPAAASWYGPGLYGNPLACGGTLTPWTMGVAHRTMPCGAKLQLRHGGNTVAVRVVDRGPFAGNREFDLTAATKEALGFGDVGTVLTSK